MNEPDLELPGETSPILQQSVMVLGQPPEVRWDFGRKVYSIVAFLVISTLVVAAPGALHDPWAARLLERYPWIFWVSLHIYVWAQILHFGVVGVFTPCFRHPRLVRGYLRMLRTCPWNAAYLALIAAAGGIILGAACLSTTERQALLTFLVAAAVLVVLTLFAMATPVDFSKFHAVLEPVVRVLLLVTVASRFVRVPATYGRILCGVWASVLGSTVVLQTQLVFGSARRQVQKCEYTLDMHTFVAFLLHCASIMLFLMLLLALAWVF